MSRAVLVLVVLSACGGETKARRRRSDRPTSHTLYPMTIGNAWSYDVESENPDAPTLLVNKVVEVDGRRVVMETGGAPINYELRRDGIYWPDKGGYLLREPISEGAGWGLRSGSHARILSTSRTVRAAGQVFEGCVEVLLESPEQRVRTVYARNVGPIYIEAELRIDDLEYAFRATLRGFAVE